MMIHITKITKISSTVEQLQGIEIHLHKYDMMSRQNV